MNRKLQFPGIACCRASVLAVLVVLALSWWGGEVAAADDTLAIADAYRVPERLFSGDIRGPYRTGTFEELWVDERREDATTSVPGDKRRLMVQVWYPAETESDSPPAPYALHRELYPRDQQQNWLDRAQHVVTTSALAAPLVATPREFPVLIYNPGAGYPPFSATFQTEFLASHGYVVVAVGHSDVSRIERFPDGTSYRRDRNVPRVSDEQRRGMTAVDELWSWIKQISQWETSLHVRDISFVLDALQSRAATRGNFFYQRLDMNRVGSLGWSLGGATSFQASRDEPRIKAAVNFDGRLYTDAVDTGTHRPILMMHGDRRPGPPPTAADREVRLVGDSLFWRMFSKTDADWYDLTLRGAHHQHFSDLTLLSPVDSQYMHPKLAHDIVNEFTLEFFDKYLRGRADTPLLSGARRYPDTQLVNSRD